MDNIRLQDAVAELEGRLNLRGGELARYGQQLFRLMGSAERREALTSLVVLGSRLVREGREAAEPAVERAMELATVVIEDYDRARALLTHH